MEKNVIVKNEKTWTINSIYVKIALIMILISIGGNFIQPFVWSSKIESKIEALQIEDAALKTQRIDHELRLRKLEETQIPLAELKVKVENLIKDLDKLERILNRINRNN